MKRLSWTLLAALLAPLAACGPDHYNIRQLPTADVSPLPASQRAPVFLDAIEDRSGGVKQPQFGGTQINQLGVFDAPLAPVLREAAEEQLRMLGVPVAASADQAPRSLSLALTSAMIDELQGGFLVTHVADVKLDATVKDPSGGVLAQQMIHGKAQLKPDGPGAMTPSHQKVLEMALADALAKLGGVLTTSASAAGDVSAAVERQPAAGSPRSDVDALPPQGARRRGHAVIIGVERYREKLPRAEFAAGDAKLTAEYVKRVLGYPEENVALLTDDHATRGDFEKYFERWLPNRVEPGDEVFVYFSGHGAPDPKTGAAFLVPYDADPTYIQETGYPIRKLYDLLGKLPAKRVVLAMDSCFSGAGGRSVIAKGARPLVNVRAATPPANVTMISASAGNEISNTYSDKGHGLFTYFLLEGMKKDGADLRAAFDYLKPQVERVARRQYNADQTPQWLGAR